MQTMADWARNALAIVGVLALGYWLGNSRVVDATSSGGQVEFQLTGVDQNSSLLIYHPESKSVYVYRGATQGNETG